MKGEDEAEYKDKFIRLLRFTKKIITGPKGPFGP